VSVIGVEAGEPAAFARHSIAEISDLPEVVLTRHEATALGRARAEQQTVTTSRELRAGFKIAAGHVLTGTVVADLKKAASEQLARATDPAEVLRGMQRLFDVIWGIERCPLLIVEDTDHWGAAPETAEAFFDQTARAFSNLDGVMIVAAQSDYTQLDGYKRIRDRLTAEVVLPELPEPRRALATVLERRIALAGVRAPLDDVVTADGLDLLCESYVESVTNGEAGDLRRTLAVVRTALDIAVGDPSVQVLSAGQIQEAVARTPLPPSSALGSPR
jgi:hypothetical protein